MLNAHMLHSGCVGRRSVSPLTTPPRLQALEECLTASPLPPLPFQALEECLVRVEIPSLDINQVLPLCWRRGLYDAIVRIHTVGMGGLHLAAAGDAGQTRQPPLRG